MEFSNNFLIFIGTVTWQREESLASVVKSEIMDLPSSHVFDSIAHTIDEDVTINFISGFVVRVTAQIQQLIVSKFLFFWREICKI